MDDIRDIAELYSNSPAMEHGRLERHQLEYDLTWRYLVHYLPAQGSVLEIGAATGRYSLELVRRGFQLTGVDLSAEELELNRLNLAEAGLADRATLVAADARDLSAVTGGPFDVVLLMGPLYHLVFEPDRRLALNEAMDRLRPGGIFISALISRWGVLADLIKDNPGWIEEPDGVRSMLASGHRPDGAPKGGFRGYFTTPAEITPLHEAAGLETLALAAVEPVIGAGDESYNRLEGGQRELWLDVLEEIGTEPALLGSSRHLLYIGRKKR